MCRERKTINDILNDPNRKEPSINILGMTQPFFKSSLPEEHKKDSFIKVLLGYIGVKL